jgi:hypothetical protein
MPILLPPVIIYIKRVKVDCGEVRLKMLVIEPRIWSSPPKSFLPKVLSLIDEARLSL